MKHAPVSDFDIAEPIPSAKAKPEHYIPPTVRWDFETAIQADRELNFAAVKAAHVLLDLYNHHEGCAWPSAELIAERIGVTRSTASEAVNKLAKCGWFKIVAVHVGNRQGSNRYVPCLEKAGLSVGLNRHSDKPQRRLQPRLSVGSNRLSASATADTSPVSEPIKGNPIRESENPLDSAAAAAQQGGPGFASRKEDRPIAERQPVEAIALPDGCPFDPEDIAKRPDLTSEDIAAAETSFREKTAGEPRSLAEWKRTAKAWLKIQKAAAAQGSDKGTLCPAEFMLEPDMRQWAIKLGLTAAEVSEATAAFVDDRRSAVGFKAYSRDWNASWRGWMRTAADRRKSRFAKPKGLAGTSCAV